MPNEFLWDHSAGRRANHVTRLRREPLRIGSTQMVWRPVEPLPGVEFFDEDVNAHPVDVFGLPLFGNFVDAFPKPIDR